MRSSAAAVVLVLSLVVGAVRAQSSGPTSAPTTMPSYPETNEALAQFFQDILSACAAKDVNKVLAMNRSLVLRDPQTWFRQVFGDEKGAKLATRYENDVKKFPESMTVLFMRLKDPKEWSVEVIRVENADDPKAKSYQLFALAAMENPVPLYIVKIYRPGTSASITVWSLAYVDGGFRWLSKMQGAKE